MSHKSFKGEKMKTPYIVRYGNLYIQTTLKGRRYRFGTGLKATKENQNYVTKNLIEIISDYEAKKSGIQTQPKQCDKQTSDKTLEFYIHQVLMEASILKATTLKAYESKAKSILEFFKGIPIEQITRKEINDFFEYLLQKGQGQCIIRAKTSLLKRAFDLAVIEERIAKNPVFSKRGLGNLPKRFKEPFALEEVEKILHTSLKYPKFFTNYLQVAFFSGMREGEILALKFSDIDFENEKISVERTINSTGITTPKTNSSVRKIDLLKPAREALLLQKKNAESEFVFLDSPSPKHYRQVLLSLYQMWKEVLIECGLRYRSLYNTRHSFASIMLSRNEDIAWISKVMLGHKNISITFSEYAGYIPSKEKRARFLDDFDISKNPKRESNDFSEEAFLEFGKKNLCNGIEY